MAAGRQDQLKLGAFLYPTGHHVAAWRHPEAQADAGVNFTHYKQLAHTAERGKFDLLFMADSVGTRGAPSEQESLSRTATRYVAQFEPITLLSGLAAATEHIGLVATASTTYNEPYHIARKFASLDHISGGRAAWNLVTSSNAEEAHNFGRDSHVAHADRYARAREFAQVVTGLWDTWEDDAFGRDKEAGRFYDPDKQHLLNHRGKHFSVRGPLNVARSPQGHPVVVQAGSSEAGKALAAESAEVIFTAQLTLADAQEFYGDVKDRLGSFGRHPDSLKIMPGIFPVVGRTESEAREKFELLQSLVHPTVGLQLLAGMAGGVDLAQSAGRTRSAGHPGNRGQQEPAVFVAGSGAPRKPDDPAALPARGRCARALADRRHAGADCRRDRSTFPRARRRRLQRDAAFHAGRAGRCGRTADPGTAAPWPFPQGI